MKNKIFSLVLLAVAAPICLAQAANTPLVKQVSPTTTAAPASPKKEVAPTPGPVVITEVEQLKLENAFLKYGVLKGQADNAQKAVNEQEQNVLAYIRTVEAAHNAKYDPTTGAFNSIPPTKK